MRTLLICLIFWSGVAFGQTYPDYQGLEVNDYAGLLPQADEAALVARLAQLRADTGVEMTVLTLPRQEDYAPGYQLEDFATGLFNHWGIGDAARNDGVLVLILRDDRAMRLELGAMYGRDWDGVAQRVVDTAFLPRFRSDNYADGIREGVEATIAQIVMPARAGNPPPTIAPQPSSGSGNYAPFVMITLILGAVAFQIRHVFGNILIRFKTCPQCGQKTLRQTRQTLRPASRAIQGEGLRTIYCENCDYREESRYVIPRLRDRSSSGSSFGGGRSGGGGASGRW